MLTNKKEFYLGFFMMVGFIVILVLIFMPIFKGQNGLDYLDALYNSISKGSAYSNIEKLKEGITPYAGDQVEVALTMHHEQQAQQASLLFQKSGAMVNVSGTTLKVSGDLGQVLANCLEDVQFMYDNDGEAIAAKYGYDERQAMYNWWTVAKEADKDLKKQKKFKEAKIVTELEKKGIELAYNYYKIEPQKIGDRYGIVIFSLVFYVAYTLWYGFAIMFMFEGWGMQLEH
jgi:hypothetical protein